MTIPFKNRNMFMSTLLFFVYVRFCRVDIWTQWFPKAIILCLTTQLKLLERKWWCQCHRYRQIIKNNQFMIFVLNNFSLYCLNRGVDNLSNCYNHSLLPCNYKYEQEVSVYTSGFFLSSRSNKTTMTQCI